MCSTFVLEAAENLGVSVDKHLMGVSPGNVQDHVKWRTLGQLKINYAVAGTTIDDNDDKCNEYDRTIDKQVLQTDILHHTMEGG